MTTFVAWSLRSDYTSTLCYPIQQTSTPKRNIHALYLVWPARYHPLWAAQIRRDVHWWSIREKIHQIEQIIKINKTTISWKTRHDNFSTRQCSASQCKTSWKITLWWEVLHHLSYSPDVVSSDYHLFGSLSHNLIKWRFQFRKCPQMGRFVDSI